jgi:hypothetical protein
MVGAMHFCAIKRGRRSAGNPGDGGRRPARTWRWTSGRLGDPDALVHQRLRGRQSAAPGGFAFTADISSAQSGSLTAGLYLAHLEITKAADVRVVDLGQITVGAHPAPA